MHKQPQSLLHALQIGPTNVHELYEKAGKHDPFGEGNPTQPEGSWTSVPQAVNLVSPLKDLSKARSKFPKV